MNLPAGWAAATAAEACALVQSGGTPKAGFTQQPGIPFLKVYNIVSQKVSFEYRPQFVTESVHRAELRKSMILPGDVIMNIVGPPLGKVAIVPPAFPEWNANQAITIFRPSSAVSSLWLYHFLCGGRSVQSVINETRGSAGQVNISLSQCRNFEIPVPPVVEQGRIVAKINNLSANSNRARDHLDHIPRLVEKYKQAILAAAFRGELTREWRTSRWDGHESGVAREQVQAERDAMRIRVGLRAKGRNRSVPAKMLDLPALPLHWEWLTFDDCAWDLTVGHVGPMKDRYVDDGIPFLRSLNVRANRVDMRKVVYIDDQFHSELAKSKLVPGDLIVVRTGEPGTAAVVPAELKVANCSDLVIARLVRSLNPYYAAFYMNSRFARGVVSDFQVGVAQQHFNVGAMSEMPVPFTSFAEQIEVVRRIGNAFAWIDRLASETISARKLIDHLDQAVLAKAFRGELVPQNPNDEPASVLLERIRVERAGSDGQTRRRSARTTS